ncbi:D-alanyl-glycyl endopeptidase-like protein [Trypanosoma grayi]|uniref:D-alanyl-glycyl endopeptidase-like protein n=1 Tax=Trypanosoma grayi TaxID=71804 RepID=UPI0004F3F26F|nr:D-alanyl-glycyl endopeptidase-like protein [Trypanosoma grayi]KEG09382.1 D-alanyl-glycyl endopeptidase-like protein [Trypanosoma grayi]
MASKQTWRIAIGALGLLILGLRLLTWENDSSSSSMFNRFSGSTERLFDPLEHCTTPFSTLLGYAHSIPAFSNCHRSHRANLMSVTRFGEPDSVAFQSDGSPGSFFAGKPWTPTEYVARFYYHHQARTLLAVGNMEEWWNAKYFHNPVRKMKYATTQEYEVVQLPNYAKANTKKERKRQAPTFADIVVWSAQPEHDLPEGHMAVVVDVVDDVKAAGGETQLVELRKKRMQPMLVYIAEQNYGNTDWEGRNYSRVLRFSWRKETEAELLDPDGVKIIGRLRAGKLLVRGDNEAGAGDL